MRILKKSNFALAAVCFGSLALAACDSAKENAGEEQAEAIRDNADMQADAMEDRADQLDTKVDGVDSAAEQQLEDKAAGVREAADAKADATEAATDR